MNLEETHRKSQILIRKGKDAYLRRQEKNAKRNLPLSIVSDGSFTLETSPKGIAIAKISINPYPNTFFLLFQVHLLYQHLFYAFISLSYTSILQLSYFSS